MRAEARGNWPVVAVQFDTLDGLAYFSSLHLNPGSDTPLYRQLADAMAAQIENGTIPSGEKLPPTRELAGQLGLNRTTVSAAYAQLEEAGCLQGVVGRGSFVIRSGAPPAAGFDWEALLGPAGADAAAGAE